MVRGREVNIYPRWHLLDDEHHEHPFTTADYYSIDSQLGLLPSERVKGVQLFLERGGLLLWFSLEPDRDGARSEEQLELAGIHGVPWESHLGKLAEEIRHWEVPSLMVPYQVTEQHQGPVQQRACGYWDCMSVEGSRDGQRGKGVWMHLVVQLRPVSVGTAPHHLKVLVGDDRVEIMECHGFL
jgi:hypothetical protein